MDESPYEDHIVAVENSPHSTQNFETRRKTLTMNFNLAILGTVGVPGSYGGFETLADSLVKYHRKEGMEIKLSVYCSSKSFEKKIEKYNGAFLRYINVDANGMQSIIYDVISIIDAIRRSDTHILLLGVSGALVLPIVRFMSSIRIVTNIDGIEWKREKWNRFAKAFLRASEWAAVRFSHTVIADNQAIADHVLKSYGRSCEVISYGGDHALDAQPNPIFAETLPSHYALALCRIEPENNVEMILKAFDKIDFPLVFVGNWNKSVFGKELKIHYSDHPSIVMHDPVYDPEMLRAIRERASIYVHGHSAGGTNPSLVEMMHFGIPILAYDCVFNRFTTENLAVYFTSSLDLQEKFERMDPDRGGTIGSHMLHIAKQRYVWEKIGKSYFDVIIPPDCRL